MRFSKKIIPGIILAVLLLAPFQPVINFFSDKGPVISIEVSVAHAETIYCKYDNGSVGKVESFFGAGCPTSPHSVQVSGPGGDSKTTSTNECSLGNPVPCILERELHDYTAAMVYYVGPGLAANVAYIGAYFFSIVVQLSLQSTAYALDFLSNGWTTVRDIANMAFIFILIYIALTVMLFAETTGTIKTLALVIVIALLVNFSFFFTRLIIDTGNILAIQFYNAIPTEVINEKPATINGVKDLSASIMGAVQLQKLLGGKAFDSASQSCGGASNGQWCGLIVSTVVYVAVAAMFWMLFFAFLQVGIKFLLRIVGLWFLLIASPLAFVAKTIPKTAGYFDQWFKKLFEFSIYPAIFLFMFLILTGFTKQIMSADSGGGSILDAAMNSAKSGTITGIGTAIANVGIRMGFVLALMYVALHVSEWVVKEGSALASKVTGWSTGKALGTVGFAGRLGIGGFGNMLANSDKLANSKSRIAQGLWQSGRFLSRRSFDARNIPGVNKGGSILGGVDIGAGGGQGGWRATEKGAHAWQDKLRKDSADDRNAINTNLANINGREDARRLAEINKGWDKKEKRLEELEAAHAFGAPVGGVMSKSEEKEMENLRAMQRDRSILSKRVENMTPTQVTSLKGADIEGIVKQISESQLKAIKESGKYTGQVVEGIMRKWHEENKKAPMGESIKQLGLLSKVHETLKGMGVNLREINKYAGLAPGSKVTIDLKGAEEMKKQIISEKESYESIRDDRAAAAADRTAAGEKAKKLNKALEHAEKIIEKIKDVPEQVGNVAAPAAFEHKA